jgi:hypothetical protein
LDCFLCYSNWSYSGLEVKPDLFRFSKEESDPYLSRTVIYSVVRIF